MIEYIGCMAARLPVISHAAPVALRYCAQPLQNSEKSITPSLFKSMRSSSSYATLSWMWSACVLAASQNGHDQVRRTFQHCAMNQHSLHEDWLLCEYYPRRNTYKQTDTHAHTHTHTHTHTERDYQRKEELL